MGGFLDFTRSAIVATSIIDDGKVLGYDRVCKALEGMRVSIQRVLDTDCYKRKRFCLYKNISEITGKLIDVEDNRVVREIVSIFSLFHDESGFYYEINRNPHFIKYYYEWHNHLGAKELRGDVGRILNNIFAFNTYNKEDKDKLYFVLKALEFYIKEILNNKFLKIGCIEQRLLLIMSIFRSLENIYQKVELNKMFGENIIIGFLEALIQLVRHKNKNVSIYALYIISVIESNESDLFSENNLDSTLLLVFNNYHSERSEIDIDVRCLSLLANISFNLFKSRGDQLHQSELKQLCIGSEIKKVFDVFMNDSSAIVEKFNSQMYRNGKNISFSYVSNRNATASCHTDLYEKQQQVIKCDILIILVFMNENLTEKQIAQFIERTTTITEFLEFGHSESAAIIESLSRHNKKDELEHGKRDINRNLIENRPYYSTFDIYQSQIIFWDSALTLDLKFLQKYEGFRYMEGKNFSIYYSFKNFTNSILLFQQNTIYLDICQLERILRNLNYLIWHVLPFFSNKQLLKTIQEFNYSLEPILFCLKIIEEYNLSTCNLIDIRHNDVANICGHNKEDVLESNLLVQQIKNIKIEERAIPDKENSEGYNNKLDNDSF